MDDDWTGSLLRIAAVLAISAAVSVGTALVVDRSADRPAVIAPVRVIHPPASADGVDHGPHPTGIGADPKEPLPHPARSPELFE